MESPEKQKPSQNHDLIQKKLIFLTALCLFFSAVEFAIPKPIPFLRLGLANIPVILSFFLLSPVYSILLIVLKIFVQNLISGTLFSYTILFSIAGSFASGLGMLALYSVLYKGRRQLISLIGLCLAGALLNSLGQLAVSYFFMFGQNTKYIAPVFLCLSLATGLLLGIFTEYFVRHSKWFALAVNGGPK